ncbi:unnamed protein product [Amaranthus hypochondriacus]
MTNIWILSAA